MTLDGSSDSLYEAGITVRREVLGDAYVDRALAATGSFNHEFQQFITEYCWGAIWSDERLGRRDRSLLTLAMTAALGRMDEFRLHLSGAIRNGVTEPELAAVLKQIGVYCGVPAGVSCLRVLREVLAEGNKVAEESPPPSGPRSARGANRTHPEGD
jgi:4-carboxymuconolactone decarboxylase